ncbi:MAG: division plane positioning ATPase MipZ [Sphingomonadaceae bacterium]
MSTRTTIVLANEKGGTGKSTLAVHLAVALAAEGRRVALFDLDQRQKTSVRYLENRARHAERHGLLLPMPVAAVLPEGADAAAVAAATDADILLFDTPGRDSAEARQALAMADTLVTPINDSFIDFDLIGQVDGDSFRVTRPSFYAETVWKARQARARADGASVDWVVLRNRLSTLEARNRRRVGDALAELAKRVGFRVVPGLSERVIYRELFPSGLTLLDAEQLGAPTMSHVAARAELRELLAALAIDSTRQAAC